MAELGEAIARVHIPPRSGRATQVQKGQRLKLIDLQGQQIGDFFSLKQADTLEYVSPGYTRTVAQQLSPNPPKDVLGDSP